LRRKCYVSVTFQPGPRETPILYLFEPCEAKDADLSRARAPTPHLINLLIDVSLGDEIFIGGRGNRGRQAVGHLGKVRETLRQR
jgi:hypothetical protein